MDSFQFHVVIISLLVFNIIVSLLCFYHCSKHNRPTVVPPVASNKCGKMKCGGDPVFDPVYNLREIAKQCVLLEDHLMISAKFCSDCCVKHLLNIVGLAEEALGLAGARAKDIPALMETVDKCHEIMAMWQTARGTTGNINQELRAKMAGELRVMRKKIIEEHF